MAKRDNNQDLKQLVEVIAGLPEGVPIRELEHVLGASAPSRRTLQRWLIRLVDAGRIIVHGAGRGRYYRVPNAEEMTQPVRAEPSGLPLTSEGRQVLDAVTRPLVERQPVGYRKEMLSGYEPNTSAYLSPSIRKELFSMGKVGISGQPAGTYTRQLMDRLLIDLSWNSSRLEGNTYSLLETKRLFEFGETAEGKGALDAQMILNHKAAIEMIASEGEEVSFNRYTICNLHALLSDNLLSDPGACGRVRSRGVGITGTVFEPLDNPPEIEAELNNILVKASAIRDPFEQAFFAMVHLPYLQPFEDVNKRVSRLAANIPLIRHDLCPLSFTDVPQADYVSGLLGVYELNRVELLRDVFVWAYGRSSARYSAIRQSLGEPDHFRLRYRAKIGSLVQEVVLQCFAGAVAAAHILKWIRTEIPDEDQARFAEVIDSELGALHEGNIARYRLRPSEFDSWSEVWRS